MKNNCKNILHLQKLDLHTDRFTNEKAPGKGAFLVDILFAERPGKPGKRRGRQMFSVRFAAQGRSPWAIDIPYGSPKKKKSRKPWYNQVCGTSFVHAGLLDVSFLFIILQTVQDFIIGNFATRLQHMQHRCNTAQPSPHKAGDGCAVFVFIL